MKIVLDTDAIVAAMRSPQGGAAEVLRRIDKGSIQLALSVPLALEYEAVCLRDIHLEAAGLTLTEALRFVDAVIAICEPVDTWFQWRPQLRDPSDELVLEAAINARAAAIVGFNRRDYLPAVQRFGIEFLTPGDVLRRLI